MKNPGTMKMFLTLAILLAIAEVLILALGKGNLPVSGLILFAMFYAFSFTVQRSQ